MLFHSGMIRWIAHIGKDVFPVPQQMKHLLSPLMKYIIEGIINLAMDVIQCSPDQFFDHQA